MDRRSASTREAARERGRISLEVFATGSLGKLLPCWQKLGSQWILLHFSRHYAF
jgi:hypothetical protein